MCILLGDVCMYACVYVCVSICAIDLMTAQVYMPEVPPHVHPAR
jgi:hypothetical protein